MNTHLFGKLSVIALGAVVLFAHASSGRAQSRDNAFYVEGRGGVHFIEDQAFDDSSSPPTFSGNLNTKLGGSLDVAAGISGKLFRGELEIGYTRNNGDGATTTSGTTFDTSGSLDMISAFANAYVSPEVKLGGTDLLPYVGAGMGSVIVEPFNDRDVTFGWQLMAGAGMPIDDDLVATAGYRFRRISTYDQQKQRVEFDGADAHTFMVGLRLNLGRVSSSGGGATARAEPTPGRYVPRTGRPTVARATVGQGRATSSFVGSEQSELAPLVEARPETAMAPTPVTIAGDYGVQLAAYRKRDNAERGWQLLRRTNPDLLGGLDAEVREVALPGKGRFYRLYASGLDQEGARSLCGALRSAGRSCQVAALSQ